MPRRELGSMRTYNYELDEQMFQEEAIIVL